LNFNLENSQGLAVRFYTSAGVYQGENLRRVARRRMWCSLGAYPTWRTGIKENFSESIVNNESYVES